MSGEHCDGRGSCVGTLVCVPGAPGPITGPSTNDTGSYTISWGASSGVLDHYELWENNAGILSTAALSASLSGKLAGSYTYTVRGCNSAGCSAFTAGFTVAVALPGVPGPISGPAGNNSTTGSYTLSWGASTGTVTRYELYENNAALFTNLTTTTATIPPRTDGTYTYNVRACSPTGCSAYTANYVVTVLLPPGTPGPISAPSETPPSYRVSWGVASGTIDHYDLGESADNGSTWGANAALTTTYKDFTAKPYGTYLYQVRACNATACSVYVTASVRVTVITGLSAFADAPVVPPSVPIPDAGWVGTIPGSPDVEGGAATYKIPIEVPPGLNGMQPNVALTYNSRDGNGIAGVGWSISAVRSIYRCPNTLAQDVGRGRPVQNDMGDRLCFDGQRLVLNGTGTYGASNSEYRTEIDQFDRITLRNGSIGSPADLSGWNSYFEVEHKSGRISQYEPGPSLGSAYPPAVWYLRREFDRQGNCIAYNYTDWNVRGADRDRVLSSIVYTGTGTRISTTSFATQCALASGAQRSVTFTYEDRPDRRTTYRYGVGSIASARLIWISTSTPQQSVRYYGLAYRISGATQRSLLDNVTLCVSSCTNALPITSFSYDENTGSFDSQHRFDFVHLTKPGDTVPLGPDWGLLLVPDLDGDGTRETLYKQDTGERDLFLSTGGIQNHIENAPFWIGSDLPVDNTSVAGAVDMFNDGRADVLGVDGGVLVIAALKTSGTGVQWDVVTTDLAMPAGPPFAGLASAIDYDGDGLIDVMYVGVDGGATISLHRNRSDISKWAGVTNGVPDSVAISVPPPPFSTLYPQQRRDLNGDGLIDTVFDASPPSTDTTVVIFFNSNNAFSGYQLPALGSPNDSTYSIAGPFAQFPNRRWIDVNGDGLPDIYDPPSSLWINRGGPPGSAIFQRVPLTVPTMLPNRSKRSFVMDMDGDGRDELMVPNTRQYDYCYNDPAHKLPSGEPIFFCGADFDSAVPPYPDLERSVFTWTAYKFVEAADGSYTMTAVPTNLLAPINYPLQQNDYDADGTTDLHFRLKNETVATVSKYYNSTQLPTSALGPYIVHNHMRAPDVMVSVTNGMGAMVTWKHRPLSDHSPQTDATIGCVMPDQAGGGKEPFYIAHLDGARSPHYAFFASSMWVVARSDSSNGLGSGMNTTCYRYQDAMLNAEGRGFQGFKKIVAEEQMPVAAGEPASTFAACGGSCSPNNRRTTSQFFQEFPLTSRVSRVTVETATASPAQILSDTTYWWNVQPHATASGSWVVSGTGTVEKKYETSGVLPVSQKTSIAEIDQASGEALRKCTISSGQTTDASRDVISRDTRGLQNDLTVWWLAKLTSRELLTDFFPPPAPSAMLDGNCQLTGTNLPTWACRPASPNPTATPCPPITASSAANKQTTNYTWNPDNATTGSIRQLQRQDLVVVVGLTEASTAFSYDQYGNLLTQQVTARDVANDSTYPPANTGPVTLSPTTYTFTSDSYFVATEANPMSHIASTTLDAATGLPTYHQAVQNGPSARMVYDPLGRLLTTTVDGTQPVDQRLSACGVGGRVGDCAIKRQTFQPGAPVKTEYLDILGRTIASGVEGFDGKEILTKIDYNARGVKIAEHQPVSTGVTPGSWNGTLASSFMTQYSGIDLLGRPATKTVIRSTAPTLFEPGKGTANLVTNYSYSYDPSVPGVKTSITVFTPTAPSGQITMSRTYDPRGKLVQTVQSLATPTASVITASYVWDPAGHVTHIKDKNNNDIQAYYDILGRKTQVIDPDRGTWLYSWDGLSRLRSQKDARQVLQYYQYDAIGRMERRFVQASPTATTLLEANWQYDLNSKLGTLGAMLGVSDGFAKTIKYDALWRPWSVTTTIPGATGGNGSWTSRQFTVEYGYDRNYGRVKATGYPSTAGGVGEVARTDYTAPQGYVKGETPVDASGNPTGAAYRQVLSMSVRGQIADQLFGNNVEETFDYDDSTGMPLWISATGLRELPPSRCSTATAPLVRQLTYTYDHFLNLAKQQKTLYQRDTNGNIMFDGSCQAMTEVVNEAYQYDELQRLLGASRSGSIPAAADSYAYDDLGNITSKSDKASLYKYESTRPHAVTSIWSGITQLTAYTYDANGNMVAGDGRTVAFDNLDRPTTVTLVGTTPPTNFGYAPDGSRYAQTGPAGTEYYVDKLYEYIVKSTGATEERTHISDAVEVVRSSGTRSLRYRDLDRLGSLETATTETGSEDLAYSHGYDAFGKPRSRDWQYSGDKMNQSFEHGFTGHEHLDDLYLIHMNGRVYDYRLGRFLSVDPIISNPANSQSINPYSYIGNNPLSGTDPTGYECQGGGGMTAPGQAPSTGSHICGSKPENSSSSISVNGNPAVSGSNMFKEAVRTFLAHNGAAPDDRPRASSDKNSPSDANAKPEPTIKDLRDWMRKNYPEFTNTLDREWSAYQKGGVPSWGSNAGPQFAGIGPLSALKLKLLLEEMIKGGGKAFAGYDTPSVFRDAAKIAEAQPELGPAEMLQKVTTEAAHVEELGNVSVHGVRNAATGAQGDFKLVIDRLQGPAEKIGAKIAEKLPGAMESLSQFLLSNMGTMSSFVVVPNTGMLERQIKGSTPGTCTTPQCGL